MIPQKRGQQAIYQDAVTANRFTFPSLLVDLDTGTINQLFNGIGIANAVDITGTIKTFTLTSAARVFVVAECGMAVNAGNTDFAYIYVDIDGAKVGRSMFVGMAFLGIATMTFAIPVLTAAAHTIKLRGYVGAAGNQGIVYVAELLAFIVSGT